LTERSSRHFTARKQGALGAAHAPSGCRE